MTLFEDRRTVSEGINIVVTDSEEVQQWNEVGSSRLIPCKRSCVDCLAETGQWIDGECHSVVGDGIRVLTV